MLSVLFFLLDERFHFDEGSHNVTILNNAVSKCLVISDHFHDLGEILVVVNFPLFSTPYIFVHATE